MHRWFVSWLLGLALVLAGCNGASRTPEPTPTTAGRPLLNVYGPMGSKATLDTLRTLVESTDIPFEMRVFEGNSVAPGIQGVLDGTFDLMLLLRRPERTEPLAFRAFVSTPIAFFVNPSVGISSLTREQVAAVYAGEVTNWSAFGGADQDIVVLFQQADDTSTHVIRKDIMRGQPFVGADRTLLTDLDVLTVVDGIPGAIGYATWAGRMYNAFISPAPFPEAIMLDGLPPTDPAYSLVSVVGVAYRPDREGFLQPLFSWGDHFVSMKMVQLLIEQFGLQLAITGEPILPE